MDRTRCRTVVYIYNSTARKCDRRAVSLPSTCNASSPSSEGASSVGDRRVLFCVTSRPGGQTEENSSVDLPVGRSERRGLARILCQLDTLQRVSRLKGNQDESAEHLRATVVLTWSAAATARGEIGVLGDHAHGLRAHAWRRSGVMEIYQAKECFVKYCGAE